MLTQERKEDVTKSIIKRQLKTRRMTLTSYIKESNWRNYLCIPSTKKSRSFWWSYAI